MAYYKHLQILEAILVHITSFVISKMLFAIQEHGVLRQYRQRFPQSASMQAARKALNLRRRVSQ